MTWPDLPAREGEGRAVDYRCKELAGRGVHKSTEHNARD
jgi:hypothetical protein